MMRKLLATLVITVSVVALGDKAHANPFVIETNHLNTLETLKPDKATKTKTVKQKKYKVVSGDSLTKIAEMYNSSVQKLYDKNKQIKNPDVLKVGQVIVIPSKGEKLKHRAMSAVYSESPSKRLKTAHTAGNGYSYGYCTWYVKNKRPDIPNSWGNADTWDDYAPSSGYKVGSTPKAGAIGVTKAYMHVVYIEKVNKDGTVLVSEMNYNGWNVVSQRVAPASEFNYIY